MQSFIAPVFSGRRHLPIKCCDESIPQARRLSLPTFRERRYLKEMHIERAKGRPTMYAAMETCNLLVWPLIVTKPQDDRYATSFAEFMERMNEEYDFENGEPEFDHEHPIRAASKEASRGDSLILGDELALAQQIEDVDDPRLQPQAIRFDIPTWAYIVRVRAPKSVLGKRAIQRNRVKRRIRAAAAQIMPNHAKRGYEYIFSAFPECLTSPFSVILGDVERSLRNTYLWKDHMTEEELRRNMYCKR